MTPDQEKQIHVMAKAGLEPDAIARALMVSIEDVRALALDAPAPAPAPDAPEPEPWRALGLSEESYREHMAERAARDMRRVGLSGVKLYGHGLATITARGRRVGL